MGNTLIGYGNYIDTATLTNGSFFASLPLNNLRNHQLARIARTSSTALSATIIDIDIGIGQIVQVFSALNHNFTLQATYRLRGSNDPTFSTTVYDSGASFTPVWPAVFSTSSLEWESDNFWTGQYQASQIVGYPWHLNILIGMPLYLRYWRFEINDIGNPAGYVQLGRIFIGNAWSPSNGVPFGFSLGWEDPTTVQTSLSSSEYFDPKPPCRVARPTTQFMPTDEAFSNAFEIQRVSGIWKEIIYVHDVDDTVQAVRRRFPARLRTINPVVNPYPDFHDTAWEIKEITP